VAWVADDGGQEARRRSGEGRWSEQEKMSKMCVCNARTSVLGAPGCARDLEQDVVMRKQELARRRRAWRHGEARLAAGTACRAWKKAAGRSKAAVG
jgi:hypothetical protein